MRISFCDCPVNCPYILPTWLWWQVWLFIHSVMILNCLHPVSFSSAQVHPWTLSTVEPRTQFVTLCCSSSYHRCWCRWRLRHSCCVFPGGCTCYPCKRWQGYWGRTLVCQDTTLFGSFQSVAGLYLLPRSWKWICVISLRSCLKSCGLPMIWIMVTCTCIWDENFMLSLHWYVMGWWGCAAYIVPNILCSLLCFSMT